MKDIHSNLPFKKGRRPSIVTDKKCCYYNYEGVNYSISKEKPSMTHSFDEVELDLSMGKLYAAFTAHSKPCKFLIPQEEGQFKLKVTFSSTFYRFIKRLHGAESMTGDVYLYRKGEQIPISEAKATFVDGDIVCDFPPVKMKTGMYFLIVKHLYPLHQRCKAFKQISEDIWSINFEVEHTPYEFISINFTGEGGIGWVLKDREMERSKKNVLRLMDIIVSDIDSYTLEELKEMEQVLSRTCKEEW